MKLQEKNIAGGNSPLGTTTKETLELSDIAEKAEGVKTFFDLDPAQFQTVLNLNLTGTVIPTQIFLKPMVAQGKGAIVNNSRAIMTAWKKQPDIDPWEFGEASRAEALDMKEKLNAALKNRKYV